MEDGQEGVSIMGNFSSRWQYVLDKIIPYVTARWISLSIIIYIYALRVYFANGWYVVTYGLGIYLLNQLVGFISPQGFITQFLNFVFCTSAGSLILSSEISTNTKFDPDDEDIHLRLPVSGKEEFRPFARRLPEFKFWHSCTKAVMMSLCMTLFRIFDVPVFWPVLLVYFVVLFCIQMKRQIRHMIKHRYIPISWGKKKYEGSKAPLKGGGKHSL